MSERDTLPRRRSLLGDEPAARRSDGRDFYEELFGWEIESRTR